MDVKNVDRAYTSDSTALNQWESVTANVNAPIIAQYSISFCFSGLSSMNLFKKSWTKYS